MGIKELENYEEYDNHKLVAFIRGGRSGLRGFIAIHRGNRSHPAFGATRIWNYESDEDALSDALNLSRGMSYKAAMAGLNYGGGKGVIIASSLRDKSRVLAAYARRVNLFGGSFITGADVGVAKEDVGLMRRVSPYMVGVKRDPVRYTVQGLFVSIQECLREVFGDTSVRDRTFAIQGVGKIGGGLLKRLYNGGAKITIADINEDRVREVKEKYPKVEVADSSDIHKIEVDVFSPNALSGCLNKHTISKLKCPIVCGGANNQLNKSLIGYDLHKAGILYAPDYIVNGGGLISVVDEYENKGKDGKRVFEKVENIGNTLKKVIDRSKRKNVPTNIIADQMAEKIFNGLK